MISLSDISFSYPKNAAFNHFDLKLERDTHYLLTGLNGEGKTTLLKLLSGMLAPVNGKVKYELLDESLDWDAKYEWRKKNIHYLPVQSIHDLVSQHELFYQQRYYNIEAVEIPTVRSFLGAHSQAIDALQLPDSFQLESLFDVEITRLSNGQVKKVLILKKILESIPLVLILDYPFEGLDAASRRELRDFLDHLATSFQIQLIIADQEHAELPQVLSKKITLSEAKATITNLSIPSSTKTDHVSAAQESNSSEPVVEMQQVKIQYDDKVILENLNWKIFRGERWALTGRNGSGKTTLFSLIYADHPMAYSEKVSLFGKRRGTGESIWDIKKRISYLGPEQIHFLDHFALQLTVLEYLQRTHAAEEKITTITKHFGIEDWNAKALKTLSNGQLQLVLLISLFLSQKELLLLDEPFQFLDPPTKKKITDYLLSHLDANTTLVLITHYETDVEKWTQHKLDLNHHNLHSIKR
jgi:molybdate transport system ATP-binding protein